ncbi:hypothetical protein GCM10010389_59650 [Streptomyces echinoruber]|uniref:Uncharacterized protein n=1 Tax=Streptomyces echinoruber TaxID=68898 RepID=A0A918RVV5_9ACTN|nr:hypothetical protein GCM10010389_59650 [Streptomyces echinoruber]
MGGRRPAPVSRRPAGVGAAGCADGWETGRMPVLDPNPRDGQKKMLLVFGSFFAIFLIIAVIATIVSP